MPPAADAAWTRLARAQHGVISRGQLNSCGLSPAQVARLLKRSLLIRQAHGLYRAAPSQACFEAALWVAVLATGGLLSGSTAAHLWGMVEQPSTPIRVTVPSLRRVVAPAGVCVLRRDLPAGARSRRYGLPVTSRTVAAIDHLVELPLGEACAFTDRALQSNWIERADLLARLESPMRGNTMLRRVLPRMIGGAEAESERMLHRILQAAGIRGWVANHQVRVAGVIRARIDVAFAELRIAIEVDGFAYHSARGRFQSDRSRQNLLVGLGWTVLRFTWSDLNARPDYVVHTVTSAIAAVVRRGSGGI
jgi:very-short-patch-repair endonuclease